MRKSATRRVERKQASFQRILDAAARRLREEGLSETAIAAVMGDAGLTHGAFYAHFDNKQDLADAAFAHAITTGRAHWMTTTTATGWSRRLVELATNYLSERHRDDLGTACGFAALASEAARAPGSFRVVYERELRGSLAAVCEGDPTRLDDAIALMTICVGGLSLSRAVPDPDFSARILRVARDMATKIADDQQD